MKKAISTFLAAFFALINGATLVACGGGGFGTSSPRDFNANVQIVEPENITADNFVIEEDTTYYTSTELELWMEVNGAFLKLDYFSLDGNKRIYDNLYFYEDDYFYMLPDDMRDFYASLSDPSDTEYVEEEKASGYDLQLNVLKSGIYKLIFDVDTMKFDVEYKAEIQTPVYYPMKNCSIYTRATNWVEMSVNPENEEEYYIENFTVDADDSIGFFDRTHTSNYKATLEDTCDGKLATAHSTLILPNVGGKYNVYVNKNTYVARLELVNPDEGTYTCIYYDGTDFISLTPYDESVPYVFRKRITTTRKYQNLTHFYSGHYTEYILDLEETDLVMVGEDYRWFKEIGTYELTINLKEFTISVEVVPE